MKNLFFILLLTSSIGCSQGRVEFTEIGQFDLFPKLEGVFEVESSGQDVIIVSSLEN